jgi:hypothetical protein
MSTRPEAPIFDGDLREPKTFYHNAAYKTSRVAINLEKMKVGACTCEGVTRTATHAWGGGQARRAASGLGMWDAGAAAPPAAAAQRAAFRPRGALTAARPGAGCPADPEGAARRLRAARGRELH